MSTRVTPNSRPITFKQTTPVSRMVIRGKAIVILNPTTCYAAKRYWLEIDADSYTATITEMGAES